jgi:WD40 repeat protein
MAYQSSRIKKFGLKFGTAFLAVCTFGLASAKPPEPPAPPPPGTVFYQDPLSGFWDWKMDAGGGAKSVLLNNGYGSGTFDASYFTYGSDQARWCLQTDGSEIAAFRTPAGSTAYNARIQVTALGANNLPGGSVVDWSNGGDAFITFSVMSFPVDENGVPFGYYTISLYRAEVSAAALENAYQSGTPFQPVTLAEATAVLPIYRTEGVPVSSGYVGLHCDWSPDGTQFCWSFDGVLRIRRADGSVTTFSNLASARTLDWEYAGDRIAVRCQPTGQPLGLYAVNSQTGAVSLIKANGGKGPNAYSYDSPRWSPDGQHLVASKYSGRAVVRMTSTGAGETTLHERSNSAQVRPSRWASDANIGQ